MHVHQIELEAQNEELRRTKYDLEVALKVLQEHEHFRNLAEALPQIVWATRPDGWNVYFNQQWVDYTGLTLEESRGHGWNTPYHPDDKRVAWEAWQRATRLVEPYSLECRLRRVDGVYRWWLVRGAAVRDASGEVYQWFGTCTDIQDLREAKDRADVYAQRLLAMEEDLRKSIARDLHDDVAQDCTALGLNLAYVSSHLNGEPEKKLKAILEDSRTLTIKVSRRIRSLMFELHPLQLEDRGLTVAIRMHAELFSLRFGIEVTVSADQQGPRLTLKVEETLFRIVQEALGNIVKHAAAKAVTISLVTVGESGWLTITDNGKGFVPPDTSPQSAESGWGITNMRERTRLIGGVFSIHSDLGQGTTIRLEIKEAS